VRVLCLSLWLAFWGLATRVCSLLVAVVVFLLVGVVAGWCLCSFCLSCVELRVCIGVCCVVLIVTCVVHCWLVG